MNWQKSLILSFFKVVKPKKPVPRQRFKNKLSIWSVFVCPTIKYSDELKHDNRLKAVYRQFLEEFSLNNAEKGEITMKLTWLAKCSRVRWVISWMDSICHKWLQYILSRLKRYWFLMIKKNKKSIVESCPPEFDNIKVLLEGNKKWILNCFEKWTKIFVKIDDI